MKQIYKKKNSFLELSHKNNISPNFALTKLIKSTSQILGNLMTIKNIFDSKRGIKKRNASEFSLTSNILDELNITDEEDQQIFNS